MRRCITPSAFDLPQMTPKVARWRTTPLFLGFCRVIGMIASFL